jgi:hypothetical protein
VILGRTLPGAREIAWHESYHAAALCLAGMVPKCARTDWPSDLEAGEVVIDWGPGGYRDPARAKDVLVSIVAGASTEGGQGWDWDNWPIDPWRMAEGGRGDAAMARELVEHFDPSDARVASRSLAGQAALQTPRISPAGGADRR